MKLEKCKCCGGKAEHNGRFVQCITVGCMVYGPSKDPTGEKWNALMAPSSPVATQLSATSDLRERSAIALCAASLANPRCRGTSMEIAVESVNQADALIAALKGGAA